MNGHCPIKLCVIVSIFLLSGCQSKQASEPISSANDAPPAETVVINVELSQGYALLHELVSKQSGLSRALIIGRGMSDERKKLVRDIAETSKNAAKHLATLVEQDPSLTLQSTGLPVVEMKSRDAIESHTTRSLLFAGGQFEFRLLLTQIDATGYGVSLARTLADLDHDETRSDWLKAFASVYEDYGQRVQESLAVKAVE